MSALIDSVKHALAVAASDTGKGCQVRTNVCPDWLDRTVIVPTVNSMGLAEWMAEFDRLKSVNPEIMGGKCGKRAPKRQQTMVSP